MLPSKDEFKDIIRDSPLEDVVDNFLFTGAPFAFETDPHSYGLLLDHISSGLEVAVTNLTLVGSGRIGFSLSPDRFGIPFSGQSDLDIVVVSPNLFDAAWLDLLRPVPRYYRLPESVRGWHDDHVRHVYNGKIWPTKLSGIVHLAPLWFRVFKSVSRYPQLANRDVNGLLYRTWDHARLYHRSGLRKIRERIVAGDY